MIGDNVEILSGYAFNSKEFNVQENGIPIVRIRDVGKDKSKTYYNGKYLNKYILENGDLLIGMDGDFRLAVWNGGKALLNQRVCKITANELSLNKGYMFYMLPKELKRIEDTTSFATVKHLSVKKIKDIKIPLPPLEQQKKIAAILDAADTYRQKTKALITKYDALTQSLFLDMFGDPFTNKKNFPVFKLGELCNELFLGLTSKVEYVEKGGFPLIRAKDINKGVLSFEKVKYISEKQHRKITARRITKRGDVLISKSGTLGTCAIVDSDREFTTYESIFTVRPKEGLLSNIFLVYLVRNEGFKLKLLGNKVGGTVAHLNLKMFRDFEFPLPNIQKQKKFTKRAQAIEAQKAQAQDSLVQAEDLFNSLLQRAFKGGLIK